MKLIIMIPAYNEEESISQVIENIPRNYENIQEVKILVINDGSTDNTEEIARRAGADYIVKNKKNLGLAKTFQKGLLTALEKKADIIVNIDADNQYNPNEISKLIKPIIKNKAEIVIGDRQIKKLKFMKAGNKYGNIIGSFILRKIIGTKINDASSGFRAFSKNAALKINTIFDHTYTHETIIQAVFKKIIMDEVLIEFHPRNAGQSKLIKGIFKHIKISGIIIIRTILIYKPLKILLALGTLTIIPGILIGLRFIYLFLTDSATGKIQSLILSSMLIIIGIIIIVLGLIGDLISHNRKINEEILYNLKKTKNDK